MDNYAEDFRFLNKSMLENNLVVFVGAGASIKSGFPSWSKLIDDIQNHLDGKEVSFSDNTIVPQLYYNARGKKDYNELIRELLFKPNAQPNAIHECLVNINPKYVITTNYDDLIEKQFNSSGLFLDVIEKDSDLPYAHTDHMIIKMHGGFKYNNFVLKEDDYLYYSSNFTLIENYIKALFARYTILFVGYSFNDPDTKHIFSWIRNILKDDQQRAYLINVSDEYDYQTYDYYKNLGINIIYASNFSDISDDFTERTVFILDKIIIPKYNAIAEINEIFKGYDIFNYVSGNYVQTVFRKYYSCSLEQERLVFFGSIDEKYESLIHYFNNKKDDADIPQNQKIQTDYPFIIQILTKSPIRKIVFCKLDNFGNKEEQKEFEIPALYKSVDISAFELFDYCKVKNSLLPSLSDDADMYLQKAYCFYFMKDYISCYNLLCKASRYYLSTHQLELYLITEYNRINVGKILGDNLFIGTLSDTEREKIRKEINKIESIGVYADSYSKIKNNSPISELIDFRYIYKNMYQIIEKGKKVDEESRANYSLYSGIPAYEKIESIAEELYRFMQYNYLLLDIYSETKCVYTVFTEYILLSLSSKREKNIINDLETFNVNLENLSYFDVMVMLRFLTYKELKNIISKYDIKKICLRADVYDNFIKVINNLEKAYYYHSINQLDMEVYDKLYFLLKFVDFSEELHLAVYNLTKLLLKEYSNDISYNEINSFICSHFNLNEFIFSESEIEELIKIMCDLASYNNKAKNNNSYIYIITNLANIYHKLAPDAQIAINIKQFRLSMNCLPINVLICIFKIVSEQTQNDIKEQLENLLSEEEDINIYYKALMNNILQPSEVYEEILYNKTKDFIGDRSNVSCCANLYFTNKLINKERFIDLIKTDESLSLCIDPENYNYEHFDPKILTTLTPKALEEVGENKTARSNIHNKLRENLSKCFDKEIAEIYIKYFS